MYDPCGGDKGENWLGTLECRALFLSREAWQPLGQVGQLLGLQMEGRFWRCIGVATGQLSARSFPSNADGLRLIYSFGDMKTSRWSKSHCTRTPNMVGCSLPAGCLRASGNYCLFRVFRENGTCSPLLKTSNTSIRLQCVEEDGNSEEQVH